MAKIYTIVLTTKIGLDLPRMEILGSYRKVGDARNAAATYIIDRLERDNAFWDSLFSDENHEEMSERLICYMVYIKTDRIKKLLGGSRDMLRRYLTRELCYGTYYVYSIVDGVERTFHFDIIKNRLEE